MILNKPEDWLVPRDKRPLNNEGLIGEDKILHNPLIDVLSKKMRDEYKPQHKYAIFSLCTTTRPYIKSLKWKTFYKNFGSVADLIICSNGGIIPIEYQKCYPFEVYDAHEDKKCSELYKEKFEERLDAFLKLHADKWDKIIFSFLPKSRNREVVNKYPAINKKFYVVPSLDVYKRIFLEKNPGVNYKRYPQITIQHQEEISKILGVELPYSSNNSRL